MKKLGIQTKIAIRLVNGSKHANNYIFFPPDLELAATFGLQLGGDLLLWAASDSGTFSRAEADLLQFCSRPKGYYLSGVTGAAAPGVIRQAFRRSVSFANAERRKAFHPTVSVLLKHSVLCNDRGIVY